MLEALGLAHERMGGVRAAGVVEEPQGQVAVAFELAQGEGEPIGEVDQRDGGELGGGAGCFACGRGFGANPLRYILAVNALHAVGVCRRRPRAWGVDRGLGWAAGHDSG